MAKNLPYFKFIVSEWNDGDITLCSMQAQGLFINLCSLYWSQEGVLSYTKTIRRYKECDVRVWNDLINESVIYIQNDLIRIRFLDKQLLDRDCLSKQNSKNVLKRWIPEQINTDVLPPNNERIDVEYNKEENREEQKREEEKRKEKKKEHQVCEVLIYPNFNDFWNLFDKKIDKTKSENCFKKIKQSDRDKIMQVLPDYVKNTPDSKYRKNPLSWLNGKCWNDELILNKKPNGTTQQSTGNKFRDQVIQNARNGEYGDIEGIHKR
jgi:hypothetical protein